MNKFVILFLSYAVSGGVAQAATYHVSKSGNNSNSCAQAQSTSTPKLTIAAGLGCLAAGDTLLLRAGTYDESFVNNVPSGTSWSNMVRIAAYPGETVWASPSSGTFVVNFDTARQYIEFDGINMDGRNTEGYVILLNDNPGNTTNHIRFKNAEVVARTGAPTQLHPVVVGGGGSNEFLNLQIHGGGNSNGCGTNCSGYGIYLASSDNLIDGCDIYDTTSAGIHIYAGSGNSRNNNIIRNNRIHDITRSEDYRLWGILVTGEQNQIYNNIIYNLNFAYSGSNAGIYVYAGSGSKIYNNTIANNTTDGIFIYSSSANTEVKNNIVYGGTGTHFVNSGSGTMQSNNLFGTNPFFVNPSAKDFQLQATSPAVNTGAVLPIVTTDFAGVARPQGDAPDIGAYEYRGAGSSPAPPSGLKIVASGTP